MKRFLIACGIAAAAILAFRHPGGNPAPPLGAIEQTARPAHFRKGHSSAQNALVYVVGAVNHPGLYRVKDGARIDDAIKAAGGLSAAADPASVNLAQRIQDGDEVQVLRTGESAPSRAHARQSRTRSTRRRKSHKRTAESPVQAPLDLNTADAAALADLPGVGETLASRIVEYRRLNGPFQSVDELADVAGITQRRVDALAPYLQIGAAP